MRMNISVPDALAEQVRERNLAISSICQRALREEVSRLRAIEASTDIQVYIAADELNPDPATWPNFDPARPHLVYGRHPVHGEGWILDYEEGGIDGFFPGYRSDVDAVLDRARALLRHGAESRMREITVDIGDPSLTVGFTGRWLVEPDADKSYSDNALHRDVYWGVALTRRGRFAVYRAHRDARGPARLTDYDTLDQAAENTPADIIARAAAELGETRVIWRDI
jgi:hypothetical protein